MEKPELKRKLGERRTTVEAKQAEIRRKFDLHMASLEKLEELGFNLDVASEVYSEEQILDPEGWDKNEHLLKKWRELLEKFHENPGEPLLLIKHYRYDQTECHGFGAGPDFQQEVTYVFFPSVSDIVYTTGDNACISIKGNGVMIAPGLDQQPSNHGRRSVRGTILHPIGEDTSTNEIVVGLKTDGMWEELIFDFAHDGVMVLYNPTTEEARVANQAKGGFNLSFTNVLREIIRLGRSKEVESELTE